MTTPLSDRPVFARCGFLPLITALAVFTPSLPAAGRLLVANKGSESISIVDPVAGKEIATIAEDGKTGHELIASPDGQFAFVPIYGNSGVGKPGTDGRLLRVIDLTKKEIVGTLDFGKGVRPHCPMMGPNDGMLYVTTELLRAITIVDPQSLKIVGSIPTGQAESHMLVIAHDGRRGYTANVASGTVSVLDLEGRKLVTVIPVAKTVQRIAISPDDRWIVTADQNEARLLVIDTQTSAVSFSIPLPGLAYGTAFAPDGRLVAALPPINKVALIDLPQRRVLQAISVPKSPQEVLVSPDGNVGYVSCSASKQVAAIDLKTEKVARLIEVGPGADGLAWAK